MNRVAILCADIGGTWIDFALVHPDGTLSGREHRRTPVHDIALFAETLAGLCAPYPGVALNIAIAGIHSPRTGRAFAANIPCINDIALADFLRDRLRRSVRIGNDADCFTLGEAWFGAARGHDNVFGIVLGTGVGGGLVRHRELVRDDHGLMGEWGHGPVVPTVPGAENLLPNFACGCGQRGCLDTIGGARGLERLHVWCGQSPIGSRDIIMGWTAGDERVARTMSIYFQYTANALAFALNTLGASVVPAGGGLAQAPALVAALDEQVRARTLSRHTRPLVVQSSLAGTAALLGAAML